jgi:RHS repeat-associated protein
MNLGYTGKPYDAKTGLYDYGYRDYQPATARFTTVDPVRDGSNWFAYVNNDPVNWVDLWGLETVIMIIHADTWYEKFVGGSHVSVYMTDPAYPERPTLYDPSGSFPGTRENPRPADSGLFWDATDDLVIEYKKYHESRDGNVTTYTIPSTPEQETSMIHRADELGGDGWSGTQCADYTSEVLKELGIKHAITPGGLERQLKKMVEKGEAVKGCGK